MADIVLRNGWREPTIYKNVTSVSFETTTEGVKATYYENGNGGTGPSVQVDWEQNDSTAQDYIKNRPFYSYFPPIISPVNTSIESKTFQGLALYGATLNNVPALTAEYYVVYWNDTGWRCRLTTSGEGIIYLGTYSILRGEAGENGEPPFCGVYSANSNSITLYTLEEGGFPVGLLEGEEVVKKIEDKYLPETALSGGADWNAEPGQDGYIENKPTDLANEKFVQDEIAKVQQNVQSDWNAVEPSLAAIKNKPTNLATTKYVGDEIKKVTDSLQDYAKSSELEELETDVQNVEKTLETGLENADKALKQSVKEINQKFIDTQADWDIEDETNLAAIKNKPFGNIPDVLSQTELEFVPSENGYEASINIQLDTSKEYILTWNEQEYVCVPDIVNESLPFFLDSSGKILTDEMPENDVIITLRLADNIKRIDKKYLPVEEILEGVATKEFIQDKIDLIPVSRPEGILPLGIYETKQSEFNGPSVSLWEEPMLVEGEKYVVYFEGQYYTLTCKTVSGKVGNGNVTVTGIGNYKIYKVMEYDFVPDTPDTTTETLPFLITRYTLHTKTAGQYKVYVCKNSDIQPLDKAFVSEELKAQPNWAQTDSTKLDYIKNKPSNIDFQGNWEEPDPSKIDYIQNRPFGVFSYLIYPKNYSYPKNHKNYDSWPMQNSKPLHRIIEGQTYTVKYDNETLTLTAQIYKVTDSNEKTHQLLGIGDPFYCCNGTSLGDPDVVKVSGSYPYLGRFFISQNAVYLHRDSAESPETRNFSAQATNQNLRIDKKWLPEDVSYGQSDWNETDETSSSFIKNKPAVQQSDWNQTDSSAGDFIKNKPNVILAPITDPEKNDTLFYSDGKWRARPTIFPDWNQRTAGKWGYIANKPFGEIPDTLSELSLTIDWQEDKHRTQGLWFIKYPPDVSLRSQYYININNTRYIAVAQDLHEIMPDLNKEVGYYWGNPSLYDKAYEDNGLPYFVEIVEYMTAQEYVVVGYLNEEVDNFTLSIREVNQIRKIDKKYLPDEYSDISTVEIDKTLEKTGYAADAKVVGDEIKKSNKKIDEIEQRVYLGKEYAGQLIYVGEDGYPSVLRLGRGLSIKNGVLMIVETTETTSELDVGTLDTMVLPEE